MGSVTARIKEIKQPYGGYLKPSSMDNVLLDDDFSLAESENIHSSIVGMAVDYLTRLMLGAPAVEAFSISMAGALRASEFGYKGAFEEASMYISGVKGIDSESIINACKLATFDVWCRSPMSALSAKPAADTNPDANTIKNIQIMVNRCLRFWEIYGPITKQHFTFEPNGYTPIVSTGDGDYLTKDTLWDLKVSKAKPKTSQTLQILMYWIMGKHSGKPEFKEITRLGIFNPRLNLVSTYDTKKIPQYVIEDIEQNVICYES